MKQKRASLSLSMKIIIGLSILLVVSLGLVYGTGIIGYIAERVASDDDPERVTTARNLGDFIYASPSEADPITFTPSHPEVRIGREVTVVVAFYNRFPNITEWYMRVYADDEQCGGIHSFDESGNMAFNNKCHNAIATVYNSNPFPPGENKAMIGTPLLSRYDSQNENIRWESVTFNPDADASSETPTTPYLFTVKFCENEDCEDGVVFQRELLLTVRQ